jgi:hypothetical protein
MYSGRNSSGQSCSSFPSVRALCAAGAFAAGLFAAAASASESRGLFCATPTACELQLYVENDILGGTDRYYTSGLKLGGGVGATGLVERIFQAPAEQVLRRITDDPRGVQFGLFVGQQLYTPRGSKLRNLSPSIVPGRPGSTSAGWRKAYPAIGCRRWSSMSA